MILEHLSMIFSLNNVRTVMNHRAIFAKPAKADWVQMRRL
jgi:hypothetical protein